jgi:hypothetical protein
MMPLMAVPHSVPIFVPVLLSPLMTSAGAGALAAAGAGLGIYGLRLTRFEDGAEGSTRVSARAVQRGTVAGVPPAAAPLPARRQLCW